MPGFNYKEKCSLCHGSLANLYEGRIYRASLIISQCKTFIIFCHDCTQKGKKMALCFHLFFFHCHENHYFHALNSYRTNVKVKSMYFHEGNYNVQVNHMKYRPYYLNWDICYCILPQSSWTLDSDWSKGVGEFSVTAQLEQFILIYPF